MRNAVRAYNELNQEYRKRFHSRLQRKQWGGSPHPAQRGDAKDQREGQGMNPIAHEGEPSKVLQCSGSPPFKSRNGYEHGTE